MHGDYARDVGHDSMSWEITTASRRNTGQGHWVEWREDGGDGQTIGFVNAALERVGTCRWKTLDEALQDTRNLEPKFNAEGEQIVVPMGFSERELEERAKQSN